METFFKDGPTGATAWAIFSTPRNSRTRKRHPHKPSLSNASYDACAMHGIAHTTSAMATADGDAIGQWSFYGFGQEPGGYGFVDAYGFTEQEFDQSARLCHFQWRLYDPAVDQWLSLDPLFTALSPNNFFGALGESTADYAYVGNNFSNAVDPTELTKTPVQK